MCDNGLICATSISLEWWPAEQAASQKHPDILYGGDYNYFQLSTTPY